ncbi:MAG: hypothetical protein R3176_00425 [Woeseiaceae bacterium]|nr:hypothetical protein [Woeseiaceae bacterium]
MLTCFDLEPGADVRDFRAALARLSEHLVSQDLLAETGPVGRRQRHPVMDTDEERDHEYFFVMAFDDRAQCDRAVDYMYRSPGAVDSLHRSVYDRIANPVFICWEDLPD